MAGQGEAWLVGGESGVGKSRLVEELRTLALVRGAVVLRGQAVSSGGSPVVEALFERIGQPTLLILEDLQWGRTESLRLLARLSARVRGLPLLVVATYRDDERPELPQELPAMRVLNVPRLGEQEMARLSESMIGEAGRAPRVLELLRRETEGNPFFLVEVVRALAEEAGRTPTRPSGSRRSPTTGVRRVTRSGRPTTRRGRERRPCPFMPATPVENGPGLKPTAPRPPWPRCAHCRAQ